MFLKQYSHVSIEMTAHYLTLQEEEVKEIYSDMILKKSHQELPDGLASWDELAAICTITNHII